MEFKRYEKMIISIATKLSDGELFMKEELRSEMHSALPVFAGKVGIVLLEMILTEIAKAYMRGYKGKEKE